MKKIIQDLILYFCSLNKLLAASSVVFISILIFTNYHFGVHDYLNTLPPISEYFSWFGIFLSAFLFAYILRYTLKKDGTFQNAQFIFFLLLAPALFAWKMSAAIALSFSADRQLNVFWNKVAYWPIKLVVIISILLVVWRLCDKQQPFYGLSKKGFSYRPYFAMLAIMIPLIALASTQADFLHTYPKLKNVAFLSGEKNHWWHKLAYEFSYGLDFVGIELFFRGFLVLGFAKWVGKDAILPMALFYCTIHFGKPLGECISSFFGGIILGVVTYHTRSIYGGLIVHLGIAWLMELGGYLGNKGLWTF